MNITEIMEDYAMKRELEMLDTVYEGMQKALSQQYHQSRSGIYKQYGVEEPKAPEPESGQEPESGNDQPAAKTDTTKVTSSEFPQTARPAPAHNHFVAG